MAVRAWGRSVVLLVAVAMLGGCIPHPLRPDDGYRPAQERPDDRYRAEDQRYDQQRDDEVEAPRTAPPAWQARTVTADAQQISPTSYTVRPGDTLRGIADRTGAGSEAIARANGIEPPFIIQVGQQLAIPGGRYHLVRPGETGIAIARAYGVEWSRVVTENALTDPYILRVGMRVLIPGGPQTVAERAAAFTLDVDDIEIGRAHV